MDRFDPVGSMSTGSANQVLERLAHSMQLPNIRFPRLSLKRLLLGGLSGSVGILGVLVGIGFYIVEILTRPKRIASFVDLYTFSPFDLNLPAEEVNFPPLYGDHQVSGWYVAAPGAKTTIIVCPGYRSRRADVLGITSHLWKAGHNVLAFEYYGHGSVVGKPVTLGYREINDFMGALAYAKQRAPQTRLGVVGYSMGASVAIIASARATEIEALVADSPFATHRSAVAYAVRRTLHLPFELFDWITDLLLWWRAGYRFNQVEPIRDIARLGDRPVLIIHGMKDSVVDPHDSLKLYEAARGPKELWLLPKVDHCGAYFDDRLVYVKRVLAFFDHHLKQLPVQLQEVQVEEGPQSDGQLQEAS